MTRIISDLCVHFIIQLSTLYSVLSTLFPLHVTNHVLLIVIIIIIIINFTLSRQNRLQLYIYSLSVMK